MSRIAATLGLAVGLTAGAAYGQDVVALYEVEFVATWSALTHPGAVPPLPHFSPPIAASHEAGLAIWEPGGLASPGIEDMAELGATATLAEELEAARAFGTVYDVAVASAGFDSPGAATLAVLVRQSQPRLTFVSMVAPSPDWFVGVSGVPLFEDGAWIDEVTLPLYAWDAGTDLGIDFLSPDAEQEPPGPIALLGVPFAGTPALGTLTLRRVTSATPCFDALDQDGDGLTDYPEDPGCTSAADLAETEAGHACDDGLDDDGDGAVDHAADVGCAGPLAATESPQCQDGIDNDDAAGIDFDGGAAANGSVPLAAPDPQCTEPWRNREAARSAVGCGIGPELGLALAALAALRRRRAQ